MSNNVPSRKQTVLLNPLTDFTPVNSLNSSIRSSEVRKTWQLPKCIGNFAAHPIKSNSTGEIVEVEIGEAEWLLDVLELLFDFYFVQPAITKAKREALNQKLLDAGKPPMK